MRRIAVELPRWAYLPGETVEGRVLLQLDKPVEARAVKLEITGFETTRVTVGSGKDSHTYTEKNFMLRSGLVLSGPEFAAGGDRVELSTGDHTFDFRFTVPEYALPSYSGTNVGIDYSVLARVDVPWWFDITHSAPFYVFRDREAVRLLDRAARFQSPNFPGHYHGKPSFLAEVERTGYVAGDVINGFVVLHNLAGTRLRKVDVRLIGEEYASAKGHRTTAKRTECGTELYPSTISEGAPQYFRLPIPGDVPSSYEGVLSNLRWAVEVNLDIPWAFDVRAMHPVEIIT